MAVRALHSVPHSPPTARLAARTPCRCPAGMRPPWAPGPPSPSGDGAGAGRPGRAWASRRRRGLGSAGPGLAGRVGSGPRGARHVRRGSLAGPAREGGRARARSACGAGGGHALGPSDAAHGRPPAGPRGGGSRGRADFAGPAGWAGDGAGTLDLARGVRMGRHVGPRGVGRAAAARGAASPGLADTICRGFCRVRDGFTPLAAGSVTCPFPAASASQGPAWSGLALKAVLAGKVNTFPLGAAGAGPGVGRGGLGAGAAGRAWGRPWRRCPAFWSRGAVRGPGIVAGPGQPGSHLTLVLWLGCHLGGCGC